MARVPLPQSPERWDTPSSVASAICVRDSGRFVLSHLAPCGFGTRTVSPEHAKLSAHLAQVGASEVSNPVNSQVRSVGATEHTNFEALTAFGRFPRCRLSPWIVGDRGGRHIPGQLLSDVQRNRLRGATLALASPSRSRRDIPQRRRHIPAAICRDTGRHITRTANPGDRLELLDSQCLESIMRNWMRREYPAVLVGISRGTVPVIGRSG
jgi:hypothetical protein